MQAEKLFDIEIELLEPMLGTVPKNKDIYAKFIASKAPEYPEDEIDTVQEAEERGWTGFHFDDDGYFLFDYQVKGFFKDVGNLMKDVLGIPGLKSKIENHLYVLPRKIRLPDIMPEPLERPIRAWVARQQIVALTRSDQIAAGTIIKFQLELLHHKQITPHVVERILKRGRRKGLGQFRNGGYGRFRYKMTSVED